LDASSELESSSHEASSVGGLSYSRNDQYFALHTPSASPAASPATSAIRQAGSLETPSSSSSCSSSDEATQSDETGSYQEELNLRGGDAELTTPDTSETSTEADNTFFLHQDQDQDYEDPVAVIPAPELLFGLRSPSEYPRGEVVAFADEDTKFSLN
jgi:hypothetical protein